MSDLHSIHYVLSAINDACPECHVYFAASSEMFGMAKEVPQTEKTPFHPRSSYGISKVAGFDLTRNYREAYDIFGCSGILFNHESPRRGFEFVTRKITSSAARIALGKEKELRLGNLDALRDWGHAKDYVKVMWLMLQQDKPDDYVICSGVTHSVKEFAELAFSILDLNYQDYVVIDEALYRPSEANVLLGDSTKAKTEIGWENKYTFSQLVEEMVKNDYELESKTI